ncbi:MAG: LysR family transcriptional regulator [Deltaproteobacteria bacterium]|nr:MAG: LysR family transcriptional regulator [Deltaproteobacteria bacterium]
MPLLAGVPDFVHVAEQRSFRGAARILGVTPTAVSKAVSRLEERLGTRLLNRTSRHVSLTPEGEVYLRHCRDALDQLQAGEDQLLRTREVAQGSVAVSLSFVFGRPVVAALPRLVARHPGVSLRLSFTDRDVSLAEEDVDVAVRIGTLPDSSLVARRLPSPRWVTVASPGYLARAGTPRSPGELAEHACLRFARPAGGVADWRFASPGGGEAVVQRVSGPLVLDHGDLLVDAAVAGLGVAQVFDFMAAALLRSGALVQVLADRAAAGPPVHALTLPGRQAVPKVRVALDFFSELLVPRGGEVGA